MENSRSLYLKKNTPWSLTLQFTTIICGFVLPRFILGAYGSETNGLISSITNFLGFISFCELGVGAVVPANLYRPLAEKDNDKISAVVVSAQRFYRIIALILAVYVLGLICVYPIFVAESFNFIISGSLIFIIAASTFFRYFFGVAYTLLLKSDQKQYIPFITEVFSLLANTVVSIILIKLGLHIIAVKAISSLIFIARPLILTLYVKKHYNLNLKIKYTEEPIKQKWNGIAQHIAFVVQEKADVIILTFLSTLTNVSVYGVYYMVVNGIRSAITSLSLGVSSYLGNVLATEKKDVLLKSFYKFEWLTHTATTYLFTVAGILLVPFVRVYTAGLHDSSAYIAPLFSALICCAIAVKCIQLPYDTVVQVAGHFKETQLGALLEPALNILVSVVFVYKFGLVGIAVGTLVSTLYKLLYLAVYLIKNIINISAMSFIKQLLVDTLSAGLMVLSACWLELKSVNFAGWLCLALPIGAICLAVCLIVNLIFYRAQFASLIKPTLNKLRRRK